MAGTPDPCGGRVRRPTAIGSDKEAVAAREAVKLSALGHAFLAALRDDERFKAIIADPFGEHDESEKRPAGTVRRRSGPRMDPGI